MCRIDIVIQEKIKELSFQKKLEAKRIIVFGWNGYTECIDKYLHEEGYGIYAIIDNDEKKQGMRVGVFQSVLRGVLHGVHRKRLY